MTDSVVKSNASMVGSQNILLGNITNYMKAKEKRGDTTMYMVAGVLLVIVVIWLFKTL